MDDGSKNGAKDEGKKKDKDLTYGFVEVFERHQLGIGCYGKVYKAKCGQLPCVAKVFHDALFKFDPANEQSLSSKVEKDCRHLSSIKHPHLVTYLGFIRDSKSKRLLLLMEAMDENLTEYLEKIHAPVPLRKQISFGYDIALALSYLHSIKCIHKNVSSSNVLLLAGRRAKLSDYGITSFANFGTIQVYPSAYMPPEVRREPSHYTTKTDIFSYGVLLVQIATKEHPKPALAADFLDSTTGEPCSEPHPMSNNSSPGNVREIDLRKFEIARMDADNPLLQLVLDCLKDKEHSRPSANKICQYIEMILPATTPIQDREAADDPISANSANSSSAAPPTPTNGTLSDECIIDNFKKKLGQLLQELSDRNDEIAERDGEIKMLDQLLQEKSGKLADLEQQLQEKNLALGSLHRKKSSHSIQAHQQDSNENGTEDTSKQQQHGEDQKKKSMRYVSRKSLGHLPLQWSSGQPAPKPLSLYTGSAVMDATRVYISLINQIYSYTTPTSKWIRLPECSQRYFSLALVHEQVVVIGGIQGAQRGVSEGEPLNTLKSLAPNKVWDEFLPPMPTKRAFAASLTTPTHLVVAGGKDSPESNGLTVVEILQLESMQWTVVDPLPTPTRHPQILLNNDHFYFSDTENNKVYTRPLHEITPLENVPVDDESDSSKAMEDSPAPSAPEEIKEKPASKLPTAGETSWRKISNLPTSGGTKLLSDGGLLLGFGGHDHKFRPSKVLAGYNSDTDSWKTVGSLVVPKWGVQAVSLPGRKFMVVGGNTSIQDATNVTDIATMTSDP